MLRIATFVVSLLSVYVSLVTALCAAAPTDPRPLPTEGEARILAALGETTAADFETKPFSELVEALEQKHKIQIQFDNKAISDAGVGTDTPMTVRLQGITLRSLLRLMLNELDLTYVVGDGYLLLTSKTEAENMLRIKVYPVRDLVTLDSEFRPPLPKDRQGQEDYHSLINLMTTTVAPTTWDEVGGPGSIQEYRRSHSITFSQTEDVHAETADLLAALRRVRDLQVAAAKAAPHAAQPQPPAQDDGWYTKVYRLLPGSASLPWPGVGMGGGMGGGGMGGGGMGGGGMGGGMYRLAEEKASDTTTNSPAAVATPATPAAASPVKTSEANNQAYALGNPLGWDLTLLNQWSDELARSVPQMVEPKSWGPDGGSIQVMAGAIVVRQRREVQEKVAEFLAEVVPGRLVTQMAAPSAACRLPAPGPQLDWPKEVDTRATANHARIEAGLDQKCDVEFHDEPLGKAIDALAGQGSLQVWFDSRALSDAGVSLDLPITRSIHGLSLRTAFKLVLGELDLTYVIHNEVFAITSKTEAENLLVTKVYPVFDLITDGPGESRPELRQGFQLIGTPPAQMRGSTGFTSLIANITSHVGPTTWDEVGGPGAIEEFVNSGALVISQTCEIHEQIATYLKSLRDVAVVQR